MWPEKEKYGFKEAFDGYARNDLKLFEEEYVSLKDYDTVRKNTGKLSEFEKDVHRGYNHDRDELMHRAVTDPFYSPAKVKNNVMVPYDAIVDEVVDVLEGAREIADIIRGIGFLCGVVKEQEDAIRVQGDHIAYLEQELHTLSIENQGPAGKQGLPGATGPQGPPGEPAPDLHQEVLDAVTEMMETYKDLQEQIDDINEEL